MKKIIIVFFILLVVCISCYVGINTYYNRQFALYSSAITYSEINIREELAEYGKNLSTWDEFELYVAPQQGLRAEDRIGSLPGQPKVSFRQYSGYVTVDGRAGRELFYYFVESAIKPYTKPLVLWLNGGPFCSSLIGAMVELGPFRVMNDGATLGVNPYAWNKVANMIFLETPAGVGFSYSNTTSDYKSVGDKFTAQDAYTFLINWLERFPGYKNCEFYITGESYAGHTTTQLAKLIFQKNNKTSRARVINLRGIAVGNAFIDNQCQTMGTADFFYKHAVISKEVRDALRVCAYPSTANSIGLLASIKCQNAEDTLNGAVEGLNVYALNAPTCNLMSNTPQPNTEFDPTKFDPCTVEYTETYFNTPRVQETLHAKVTKWEKCNSAMNRQEDVPTVLLTIKELMATGLRIWLYSGETDSVVPVEATEYAIQALELPVKTDRYPWYNAPNEVGGYATEYHNLTFVTVKDAGHLVPSCEPARALTIFSSFLRVKPLPGAKS